MCAAVQGDHSLIEKQEPMGFCFFFAHGMLIAMLLMFQLL